MSVLSREPVRVYLASLIAPALALLVAKGIIDSDTSLLVGALAAAVLAVPAVEVARSKVTPVTESDEEGAVRLDQVVTIAFGIVCAVLLLYVLALVF